MIPEDRLYTEEHEWIEREEDECVIGITHFAQDELGDVVFVELPKVGDSVDAGAEMGTIESVKAVAELYSPVGGEIVAVNESVADTPELLNEDPYGEGWLVRIKWRDEAELDGLMSAEQYRELIG